jgi:transcriptional regulator with XRE-family HTH domain
MAVAERWRLLDTVREAIAESGIEPAEMARRSGIDKAALSRFLRGTTGLSVESVEKIAPVVGLKITARKTRGKSERTRTKS